VGRSILELTAALAEQDTDLRFSVLATQPEMFSHLENRDGWSIVPCPAARGGVLRKTLFTQFALPGLLRRQRADLLHALQFVAPLRAPCPTVVTVHDLGYRHFPRTVERARRAYYRLFVPPTLRRAAAVVTNSRATADDVSREFPEVAARVRATPFGTPRWVWERAPAGEATTEANREGPYLFVGTLEPRKNIVGLLAAYTEYRSRKEASGAGGSAPDLLLIGAKGWQDSEIGREIGVLLERGWARLEGYAGRETLWDRYRSARALLFPSLHEGFGFPILEAMAAGLPVLTSDRGAMAEVAGDAALTVDPTDREALIAGLERIHDDRDLRARLIRRGLVRARRWDWGRTARATITVYRAVLAGRALPDTAERDRYDE
jgi:glycosyltransferase involved in cell wall biosynthesis